MVFFFKVEILNQDDNLFRRSNYISPNNFVKVSEL